MSISSRGFAGSLLFTALAAGCDSSAAPSAPPLDIRGQYNVSIGLNFGDPSVLPGNPDSTAWRATCLGVVSIDKQGNGTFGGSIQIQGPASLPCHAGTFPLRGTMTRDYSAGEESHDYGWELTISTDINQLIGCTFVSRAPYNTSVNPGDGSARPVPQYGLVLQLLWENVYDCGGRQWLVLVDAEREFIFSSSDT